MSLSTVVKWRLSAYRVERFAALKMLKKQEAERARNMERKRVDTIGTVLVPFPMLTYKYIFFKQIYGSNCNKIALANCYYTV